MSWKPTLLLLTAAGALFAFIYLIERHQTPTTLNPEPARLLVFNPAQVTNIQVRLTNELVLRADRSNELWSLSAPITYPAQYYAIEGLLHQLSEVRPPTMISPEEMKTKGQTIADFGLDIPQSTVTLFHAAGRSEIRFGNPTPARDQLYAQLLDKPAVFLVSADLLKHVPRAANDWRDTALVAPGTAWNRLEIRLPGRTLSLNWDVTNKFTLAKPFAARADQARVDAMLRKVLTTGVHQFLTDQPRSDLEPLGLKTPEAEMALGVGTNDVVLLQFGKSPTNDSNLVYARLLAHTNIVLISKSVLEALQVSANDLRDRHLANFATNEIDTLEIFGPETFTVRRQANGQWAVIEPQAALVDADMMRDLLVSFSQLEGAVEKDLVTDFAPFGLVPPARQYILKTTITNTPGPATNRVLARIELSAPQNGKTFARRGDEGMTLYSLPQSQADAFPTAAWQLRDRRVWTFTTNQVLKISVSQAGVTKSLLRTPAGKWTLGDDSQGIINSMAIEELAYRLGELQADNWVARGETNRALYGFTPDKPRITVDLKVADKPYQATLEFGDVSSPQFPLALTTIDGQTYIFKFPLKLYVKLASDIIAPLLRNN
jgi:hypothetical protein